MEEGRNNTITVIVDISIAEYYCIPCNSMYGFPCHNHHRGGEGSHSHHCDRLDRTVEIKIKSGREEESEGRHICTMYIMLMYSVRRG